MFINIIFFTAESNKGVPNDPFLVLDVCAVSKKALLSVPSTKWYGLVLLGLQTLEQNNGPTFRQKTEALQVVSRCCLILYFIGNKEKLKLFLAYLHLLRAYNFSHLDKNQQSRTFITEHRSNVGTIKWLPSSNQSLWNEF